MTRTRTWAGIHLATLLAGGLWLLYLGRNLWFFFDEWDIVGNHALGLFQPHNEHWSTLPYLAYRALYPVFGLRQYLPYLAVMLVLHLGVTHLLWRLLRSEGVGDGSATALAAVFLVFGPGAENLDWAWQMGFVGSVFFGLAAVLLAATGPPTRRRDVLAAAALLAGLMSSGIGVPMLLVTALAVALRRGPGPAVAIVAVPELGFGVWYGIAGHAATAYQRPGALVSLQYMGEGLAATAELGYDVPVVGPALVLGAVGWAAWQLSRRREPLAVAAILGAVGLFGIISLGRVQYGPNQAAAGRYLYVGGALLVLAAGVALRGLAARGRLGRLAAGVIVAAALLHNAELLAAQEAAHSAVTAVTRQRVVEAGAGLTGPGPAADPQQRPDPRGAPTLTLSRVAGFARDGALPAR